MNIWKILGIEETKDKDAIRAAYRSKVVSVNPEENQKGFMELRQAYEEALKWSDSGNEEQVKENTWPDTPIGNWMAKADKLYQDIHQRGNVDKWRELLEEDICFSLETKTDVRDELLNYFMEHRFLPQRIWILLDEKFMLREYKDELYEKYPENYVNHGVIGNIENEELFSIDYLESRGGTDFDGYLDMCYHVNYLISRSETEEAEKVFDELEDFGIYHPYEDMCRTRYYIIMGELEQAEALCEQLMEKMPEDSEVLRVKADICYNREDYEQAKKYYEKVLEIYPNYYNVIVTLGHACFNLKEYEKAKEYYKKAYDIHKSYYLEEDMLRCYAELEKIYEKKWEETPNDIGNAVELARAYYQRSEFDKGLSILKQIEPDEENYLEYVHLTGCIYMYKSEYDKALSYIEKWMEGTERLEDDGTEKTKKAMNRLPVAYQCMAHVLTGLKKYDEADAYLDKALATGKDILDTYEDRARIYFSQKRYQDTIAVCETIFQYDANSALGRGLKAESLFELYYYGDSLDEWNNCIHIEPNNLHYYLRKMECLYRMGEKEEILEVITYLEENKADADRIAMWKAIVEGEWGDKDKAVIGLSNLIDMAETNQEETDNEYLGNLYFELARIYWNREKDLKKSEQYVDKTLEILPAFVPALNYKGFICWRTKRLDEAITFYKKVLEEKPNHCSANGSLGELYEDRNEFEKAIEHYTRQLEYEPDAYMYLSRGWSYGKLGQFEKARRDYEKSIDMDSENPAVYRCLALTYLYDEQEETAVKFFKKSIEKDKETEMIWSYRNLSSAYRRLGEPEKAVEVIKDCFEKFHEERDILRLANVYMQMGNYEEAMSQYNRFAEYKDEYRQETVNRIVECLMFMNRYDEAEKLILASFKNERTDRARLYRQVIRLYLVTGKTKLVKARLKSLINNYVKNNDGDGQQTILLLYEIALWSSEGGKIEIKNKQLQDILGKMEEEFKEKPIKDNETERLCELAAYEMGKGNFEKAMNWADKALANHKCYFCESCQCDEGLFIKAMILEIQGKLSEALSYYERAMKGDVTDFQYHMEYERAKKKK